MENALRDYLQGIEGISPEVKEHTKRPELAGFLNAAKDALGLNLAITHEPKGERGFGVPDFMVTCDNLVLGYVENKRVGADLDAVAKDEQIKRYFGLSENILLTDYLRFLLLGENQSGEVVTTKECRICESGEIKALLKNKAALEKKAGELKELFTRFFTFSPTPISTANAFAQKLAQRTRELKKELEKALEIELKKEGEQKAANDDIQANEKEITSLFKSFKQHLYSELTPAKFADSFAQTLTYSLFLAKLNAEGKEFDLLNAKGLIPKSFPLIRTMCGFLGNLEGLDSIEILLKEILFLINNIDVARITTELNKHLRKDSPEIIPSAALDKDPYLHFYETFLAKYDPKMREKRGVYYTPLSIVRFIIEAIDLVLKRDFGYKKGLKAAMEKDSQITLLDFATGTGTFLLEAFRAALAGEERDIADYQERTRRLLGRFFGFELLIAPYTIAHLKISQSFKEEFGAPLKEGESINIRLTNTLDCRRVKDKLNESNLFELKPIAKEFIAAQEIKEKQILIITGNPPYSGASASAGLYEDNVRISYGLEPGLSTANEKQKLKNEKTTKWLLDDYVKFICFAESKIQAQGSGIFAFISNNAFLDNPTFRGMRYHLLQSFDEIYILDLHGSARKKEVAEDGGKDENVFDIRQGVSINVFIKKSDENKNKSRRQPHFSVVGVGDHKGEGATSEFKPLPLNEKTKDDKASLASTSDEDSPNSKETPTLANLHHYDLRGKRTDKYDFLDSHSIGTSEGRESMRESIAWRDFAPTAPFYLFIPQDESLRAEYDKGWSVREIFGVGSVGVTSGNDNFCISKSDSAESLRELKEKINWLIKTDVQMVKKEIGIEDDSKSSWQIKNAKKDLEDSGNSDKNYIKIAYRPFDTRWTYYTGKASGFLGRPRGEVMRHLLPESSRLEQVGASKRKNNPTPQNFPEAVGGKNTQEAPAWQKTQARKENFTPEFRAFIDAKYGERFTPEQILGYIYAVLFHKNYREKYLDFLKIDFPKIPFVDLKENFLRLSESGQKLIEAHLMRPIFNAAGGGGETEYRPQCGEAIQGERELAVRDSDGYSNGFMPNGRGQHGRGDNLPALSKNIGLVCYRGCNVNGLNNIFVADGLIDLHLVGGGSNVFPLYLKGGKND